MLIFGHGFTGAAFAKHLLADGWSVTGTTRSPDKALKMLESGVTPLLWDDDASDAIAGATHLLVSAGPDADGDPVLNRYCNQITAKNWDWVGYLSTIGVYGDRQGGWVDESSPLTPSTERGRLRVAAETAWGDLNLPLHIFRLAGIYGPGRGPFAKVLSGKSRRIIKEGQVFSRIHVDDIATVLMASLAKPNPGAIYNVCDNDPAPPQDVITYAAELLGVDLPPATKFEEADLTPMARSFYAESKRVHNNLLSDELGVQLAYPTAWPDPDLIHQCTDRDVAWISPGWAAKARGFGGYRCRLYPRVGKCQPHRARHWQFPARSPARALFRPAERHRCRPRTAIGDWRPRG